MSQSEIKDFNMSETKVVLGDMHGCNFNDVNLSGAKFEEVNLAKSTIHNANLSNVAITDANIKGMTVFGYLLTDLIESYEKSKQ